MSYAPYALFLRQFADDKIYTIVRIHNYIVSACTLSILSLLNVDLNGHYFTAMIRSYPLDSFGPKVTVSNLRVMAVK